jgi:predicted DNA-binding transcriptional regulator AlpA
MTTKTRTSPHRAGDFHMAIEDVCSHVGGSKPVHETTVRDWIRKRGFPNRIKRGPGTVRWSKLEIDAWLEQQRERP